MDFKLYGLVANKLYDVTEKLVSWSLIAGDSRVA